MSVSSESSPSGADSWQDARPRRAEKISEVVAREILNEIVDRDMQPGAGLPPESEMLRTFGVGRPSLREALRILETHGLIRIKSGPGGGPVVAGVHSADLGKMATLYFHASRSTFRELIEARYMMEPMMARHAAERQDPVELAKLETLVEASRAAVDSDDRTYQRTATDFHDQVAGMSGNGILDLMSRALKEIYVERVRETVYPAEDRAYILEQHVQVAEAIVAGDGDRAERLMREHMKAYAERIRERFPGMMDEVVHWR